MLPSLPLLHSLPYPWWQHSEVEKDGTFLLVERQCTQLGDGFQRGECLIDSNGQSGWTMC